MSGAGSSQGPLIVLRRWKRYGQDRAYVRVDGVQVGYRDLVTSSVHCELPEHRPLIEQATATLIAEPVADPQRESPQSANAAPAFPVPPNPVPPNPVPPKGQTAAATPAPALTAAPALLPDRDLALVPAGAAARSQAVALRQAAPVRTMLGRVLGVKTDERAWRIGADAEEEVARHLTRLGPGWHVLHAVPVGDRGSDIDHVVIGPSGVFTVNTKNHPNANVWVRGDTFKVNGQNQHYVRNSRFEASRAAALLTAAARLDVEVHGVIAVMGAHRGFTVKEQPKDGAVTVVTRKTLGSHLRSLPAILGVPSVEHIFEQARHLSTWQPKTVERSAFDVRQ